MRRSLIVGGLVALALAAGVATSSAATTNPAGTSVAPAGATSSPPPGSKQFGRIYCLAGYLCTFHQDSSHNGYYNSYYACQRIYLSDWVGGGEFMNNQTSGTVTTFYDESGKVVTTSKAYQENGIDWDPIWSFQVCPG